MGPIAPDPIVSEPDEDSAAGYLEHGFRLLADARFAKASDAFRSALQTGHLNDAGRALAYWQMHVAERSLGRDHRSVEALASFVVVAEDVLDERTAFASEGDGDDFVTSFQLELRLARARAAVAAAWSIQSQGFGRSRDLPVLVRSEAEMEHFLEIAPGCTDRVIHRMDDEPGPDGIQRVVVICRTAGAIEYYFERRLPDP